MLQSGGVRPGGPPGPISPGGPADDAGPAFYFDLASPEAYLVAERVHHALGMVPRWEPVRLSALPEGRFGAFRCAE